MTMSDLLHVLTVTDSLWRHFLESTYTRTLGPHQISNREISTMAPSTTIAILKLEWNIGDRPHSPNRVCSANRGLLILQIESPAASRQIPPIYNIIFVGIQIMDYCCPPNRGVIPFPATPHSIRRPVMSQIAIRSIPNVTLQNNNFGPTTRNRSSFRITSDVTVDSF